MDQFPGWLVLLLWCCCVVVPGLREESEEWVLAEQSSVVSVIRYFTPPPTNSTSSPHTGQEMLHIFTLIMQWQLSWGESSVSVICINVETIRSNLLITRAQAAKSKNI